MDKTKENRLKVPDAAIHLSTVVLAMFEGQTGEAVYYTLAIAFANLLKNDSKISLENISGPLVDFTQVSLQIYYLMQDAEREELNKLHQSKDK